MYAVSDLDRLLKLFTFGVENMGQGGLVERNGFQQTAEGGAAVLAFAAVSAVTFSAAITGRGAAVFTFTAVLTFTAVFASAAVIAAGTLTTAITFGFAFMFALTFMAAFMFTLWGAFAGSDIANINFASWHAYGMDRLGGQDRQDNCFSVRLRAGMEGNIYYPAGGGKAGGCYQPALECEKLDNLVSAAVTDCGIAG